MLAATGIAPVASPAATDDEHDGRHWVTAWSAAPQGPSTLASAGIETFSGYQYTELAHDIVPPPITFSEETVRQIMYLHYAGESLRVQLSNEFGTAPANLPSVTIGRLAEGAAADIEPGTLRTVTFDGAKDVRIPRGESVLSDPVDLPVEAFDSAVLNIFVLAGSGAATVHGNAQQTFYTAPGDRTGSETAGGFLPRGVVATPYTATLTTAVYYATGIQVEANQKARTLITLGDSITDGFFSSGDANNRYPDVLARRLWADSKTDHLSVANQGISGSRVLRAGTGPSIFDRIENEVFEQPNVAGVIYLQGINDIGTAGFQLPAATSEEIIDGYRRLATEMHRRNIPIFIGTLTPAGDALKPAPHGVYSTPDGNIKRGLVNDWIRTEGREVFDGVIDFDEATRDPLLPQRFKLQFDSGDSLHPNDAGYTAMADSIPLEWLAQLD